MEKKFSYVAKLPDTDELVGVIVVDHKVVRSTSNPLSWVHFSIVKYSFQVRMTLEYDLIIEILTTGYGDFQFNKLNA